MARITINTSTAVHSAGKKRAKGRFQSVSQYVSQLIIEDLKARSLAAGMIAANLLEEQQATYGADLAKESRAKAGDKKA